MAKRLGGTCAFALPHAVLRRLTCSAMSHLSGLYLRLRYISYYGKPADTCRRAFSSSANILSPSFASVPQDSTRKRLDTEGLCAEAAGRTILAVAVDQIAWTA